MKFPGSVLASVFLFVAETSAALYLSSTYRSGGDGMWQALTLLFSLLPCALVQLTLLFVHRDFTRDRPLVLLLHLLQLGPLFRCFEVFCIYCQSNHIEEPYVSITKKRQIPKNGHSEEIEKEVGQAEGKLFTHRSAFSRASVIQAFLGSAPQLTLQLYISVLQQDVSIGRCLFMVLSLLSIVYGALRCNILAIKIKYDEYDVKAWVVIDILINFLGFLFYPWILFWCSGSPFPENFEKAFSRLGTTIVLCFLTLLYAGINMFCWSAVQLKINNPDLISKSQNWYRLLVYYMVRFIENAFLLLMWYLYKTDIYMYVCAPLLMLQLLIGYCTAILFMVVFYQFFHPCKKLFSPNASESFQEWLKCACCNRRRRESCESAENTDLRSPTDREETPSSSKISSMPSQILNTDELSSA
uniref:XK-related protein n=1 Tax=Bos taurus TaxID=9913 RepID=A0AAA9U1H9_BOVIN